MDAADTRSTKIDVGYWVSRRAWKMPVMTAVEAGALRLAAELVACFRRELSVRLGTPTWPNHALIVRKVGQSEAG